MDQNVHIYRQMDLSSAASAMLSFYRNNQLDYAGGITEEIKVEVSADGGATWTTLQAYNGSTLLGPGVDSFDLTPYMSATTQVRFLISQFEPGDRNIYFDNIQIEYAVGSVYREVVGAEALWQKTGLDGQGVTVAVVDSGISDHIDFRSDASNPNQALNSPSRIIQNLVFGDYDSPNDEYAHGTHVAGIIGGQWGRLRRQVCRHRPRRQPDQYPGQQQRRPDLHFGFDRWPAVGSGEQRCLQYPSAQPFDQLNRTRILSQQPNRCSRRNLVVQRHHRCGRGWQ